MNAHRDALAHRFTASTLDETHAWANEPGPKDFRQGRQAMIKLTDDELRMELDFNRKPLEQINETTTEWVLGQWSLAKTHRTWRVGYAHQLVPGATLRTFPFDIDGKSGIGMLFESAINQPPWIFVGWVPQAREKDIENWRTFLSDEMAKRLADQPAGQNWTYEPHDGKAAQDYEDELARERFQKSLGVKPYKRKT